MRSDAKTCIRLFLGLSRSRLRLSTGNQAGYFQVLSAPAGFEGDGERAGGLVTKFLEVRLG